MKTIAGNPNQNELEIFEQIKLENFTATPNALEPFGEADLSWAVTGPDGFGVMLNGIPVQRVAQMTVAPRVNTGYTLVASTGSASKVLGSLGISVDTASCITVEASPGFRASLLRDCIGSALGANSDLSLASDVTPSLQSQLSFTPGAMNLVLYFMVETHEPVFHRVNLEITISTGFIIDGNGKIVPADTNLGASIDPGSAAIAGLFVDLHLQDKANMARMDFQTLVDAIPTFISFGYLIGDKMRYQNISIPGDPADPPFTIVACPLPSSFGILRSDGGAIGARN
jgi:hypothetical protein